MGDFNYDPVDGVGDVAIIAAARTVPQDRYNVDAFHHPASEKLNTLSTRNGHFLDEDVAAFDAPFFSITAQEATAMDPTARLLLEVTYEAMEAAGLPMESLVGSQTSCHVGCFTRDYHEMLMRDAETAPMYAGTGTGFSLLANRISWFYDLRGASMTLDTACSSSLVGLHFACQGLRNGEATTAIVCGSNLILSPDLAMWLANLRMTSTDGLSRSFAEGVTGYGRGEGIATLILKPARDALRDGDPIRAIIRGTGANQDGHTTGITVPSREAQADLIRSTYLSAGLDVGQTAYFEAHGTGTAVGDPLELGAVAQAISIKRTAGSPLYVGSVKSNIGHLEGAAGLAGMIKCILMMEHGAIAPNIHFEEPNKRIPFADWHIAVPTELTPWPRHQPKRVSINSFGYGGTNAHVILDHPEEWMAARGLGPLKVNEGQDVNPKLFVLSAPAESALYRMMDRSGNFIRTKLAQNMPIPFDQLAFTLSDRRSKFQWKAFSVASSTNELAESLSPAVQQKQQQQPVHAPQRARLTFVFTGQGAQYAQMGIELWKYPVFRASIEAADLYLGTELGSGWSVVAELTANETASQINQAHLSQPLCTVLQIALIDLLRSWEVTPDSVVGHSSGEIAAAYCYGALTREDAWRVAYYRGQVCASLMCDLGPGAGAMMAVGLSVETVQEHIRSVQNGTIVVACINSPASVTISGDAAGIDELQHILSSTGVFCRRLKVDLAYHSHHMQRVAELYVKHIADISPVATTSSVQMFSSVAGKQISSDQLGPAYWIQNLVSPVLFLDAVSTLLQNDPSRRRRRPRHGESAVDMMLEIGPHAALRGPLRQILQHHDLSRVSYASVLKRGEDAIRSAILAAGELYIHGVAVCVHAVNRQASSLTPLINWPSYPWDHSRRYWAESRLSRNYRLRQFGRHDLLGAPAADASSTQPRWRNILRVQEQPWLRDHVVDGLILYPAAGIFAMVIEAILQLMTADQDVASIHIEQTRITKAIVVPDDATGIEVVLQLIRNSQMETSGSQLQEDCWQFDVMSCSDGLSLEQNSSGRVRVRYNTETRDGFTNRTTGKQLLWQTVREDSADIAEQCTRTIEPVTFYKATHTAGLQYGPLFQGLKEITAGVDCCTSVVQVPDTQASMPAGAQSPHLVHPTTLDVIFHSMFAALGGNHLDMSSAAVPIALDGLIIYPNLSSAAGSTVKTRCRARREGERDLVADIWVTDEHDEPKVIINNLRCRELTGINGAASSSSAPVKAPIGTLLWKPDLAWLDETQMQRYVAGHSKNGTEIGKIVDLAAHKNPDLTIMQVGYSDTLIESLLSALGTSPGKTTRCSSYTVLDVDPEKVMMGKDLFQKWADTVSFGSLDWDTADWTEKSVDVAIVCSDAITSEQVQRVQDCVRPGGHSILQIDPEQGDSILNTGFNISPNSAWYIDGKAPTSVSWENQTVVLIEPAHASSRLMEISAQLSLQLTAHGLRPETARWSTDLADLRGAMLISLMELDSPFLQDLCADDFAALQTLMLHSKRVLWVAMGKDPAMQAAVGYLRVLQNENVDLDLRYLLLNNEGDAARSPENIAQTVAAMASSPTTDREYMELEGCIQINRWVDEDDLSSIMAADGTSSMSDLIRVGDARVPLRLEGSIYSAVKDRIGDCLADDEVNVQVMAMDIHHAGVAAIGFSGVVTEVGNSCSRRKPGDHVWTYVPLTSPQTQIRVQESWCQVIPESTSFEEAAVWAISFGTAYTALIEIAQLQAGKAILIQAGASSVGQFAIQIAQRLTPEIFIVTVRSEEERLQMEALGIDSKHIVEESDPDLELAISHLCNGTGLNMVLHQAAERTLLPLIWRCMAAGGVLVDLDAESVTVNGHADNGPMLSIAPFRRGATYTSYNAGKLLRDDPARALEILKQVSRVQHNLSFRLPPSRRVWPSSKSIEAIQCAQTPAREGSAIITFDLDGHIPVTPELANPLILNGDATYLLAGGTGGLGANLAKFLARKGAKNLAIVSRSGSSAASAISVTRDLTSMGVQVRFYAADISDEAAMQHVLGQCASEMPPIRGVLQCAAVLEDSIYHNMTHAQWRTATRPKMHGSMILHRLLLQCELQFFVMLSSIAGVVGNRSQANYAAGNTFQDALAHYRRSQGLPAVSIDLGLMLGIGLIAERGGATNLKKWEAVGIREAEFHALLTAAMTGTWSGSTVPTQVISGLPTGGILESEGLERPFYFDDPRFAYLKKKDLDQTRAMTVTGGQKGSTIVALVSQLDKVQSKREAADLIVECLKQRLARELQTPVENIDASQPLHSYGIDSLLAVEIRTWILVNLQAELGLFDVLGGGSIQAPAGRIAGISKAVPSDL
ncbi:polyketide synthase [Penicillium cataractarum]|uniref:Polyketide synthase n=1 Tax=Penicillium cataractarum TaxID=2100454 RepID=A0A9X0B6F2_9EURO|nr:polyketide synthase [Penicillium cataractarum]KAJ5389914.1 polyketide synthase [Penicillium cataractarum]